MVKAWYILLQLVVPLCSLGLVGNTLVLVLMLRHRLRSLSTSAYLVYLAVADMGCLLHALTAYSLHMAELTAKAIKDPVLCKLDSVFLGTSALLSSWVLVAISTERVFVVINPIKARTRSSRTWAWGIGAVVLSMALTYSLLITFLYNDAQCKSTITAENPLYFNYLNIALYSVVPGSVVSVCSVIIITVVKRHYGGSIWRSLHRSSENTQNNLTRLTVMLLIRAVTFTILTLPNTIFRPIMGLYTTKMDLTTKLTYNTVFHLLALLNHAGNPLLYTFSGTLFREELVKLFSRCTGCCPHKDTSQQHSSNSSSKRTSGVASTQV